VEVKREALTKALEKALEDKGKRKFVQSVEMAINFRGVDFSKAENRINVDVALPKGRGKKANKVVVICDENLEREAKEAGADLIILPSQLPDYADKKKLKALAKDHFFLVQPNLMAQAARYLGRYLGPRGRIPKPLVGNVKAAVEQARRWVRLANRGKFLPTLHAFIGTEEMDVKDLVENAEAVLDAIKSKVPESNIKSVYVKLTMGKAVKVE
jgi:large subunit ribosomal protein L1